MANVLLIALLPPISALAQPGLQAAAPDQGWAMYNKNYDGQRFSGLGEITSRNVHGMKEICRIKIARGGSFHTGPLVVDGVMYVTTPRSTIALDARTCALRWRSLYQPEQDEVWAANRGVAYLDGRLYRGTADGRILALDAKTGQVLWKTVGGDPARGEFFSSAPIAWGKLLYIGIAGGDWGIRGRMMAFDLASGREAWRFNTVPLPHEPGADTWQVPATAESGGGGTWGSYALDPARGEVFVPVANPAPDFAPHVRPGANLYTNSVVVLDAASGKLKWWYQLAPNDGHDYGIGAGPTLYRRNDGKEAVALAAKDGFVYVVDRATQRLLFRTATTTIENAGLAPTPEGRRFCPGVYGGSEWNGAAFDQKRNALYVGAVDWCSVIKSGTPQYKAGRLFMGGSYTQVTEPRGWVTSIDAGSGKVNWRYQAVAPVVAGITPTAGGVLLTGDLAGNFLALDSTNGKLLYQMQTGGAIAGGVVTYAVAGKQYVATTSGNVSRLTFGGLGSPSIIVLGLPETPERPPLQIDISRDEPEVRLKIEDKGGAPGGMRAKLAAWKDALFARVEQWSGGSNRQAGAVAHGKQLFAQNCAGCHGAQGGGLGGPSLLNWNARMTPEKTMALIKNPKSPMPRLYPSILSESDVADITTYLHTL
ncbi:PQQ-binding-like beta-propeller repeat protein [Janthinobacterium sp. 17J80-10]|uniref:outer membrane protein assembly factor BamB family protein n=1 Tax=Janthinobacterium sp. 17J80-10 TaxID=2497863 RepID=UPI0013E8E46A|nr:PQQ-binding-like beta-propeller repeat protein [Janthinobacterium sp. 17J80-10]